MQDNPGGRSAADPKDLSGYAQFAIGLTFTIIIIVTAVSLVTYLVWLTTTPNNAGDPIAYKALVDAHNAAYQVPYQVIMDGLLSMFKALIGAVLGVILVPPASRLLLGLAVRAANKPPGA